MPYRVALALRDARCAASWAFAVVLYPSLLGTWLTLARVAAGVVMQLLAACPNCGRTFLPDRYARECTERVLFLPAALSSGSTVSRRCWRVPAVFSRGDPRWWRRPLQARHPSAFMQARQYRQARGCTRRPWRVRRPHPPLHSCPCRWTRAVGRAVGNASLHQVCVPASHHLQRRAD